MGSDIESHVSLIRMGWEQCTDDDSIIGNNNNISSDVASLLEQKDSGTGAPTHTLEKVLILWGYVLKCKTNASASRSSQ